MTLHRSLKLNIIAIRRGEKIRTHQKQYNIGSLERIADLMVDLIPYWNPAVVPYVNSPFTLQRSEMNFKLIAQFLVLVRIR